MPECNPKRFTRYVDFLTGRGTTLEDFCERSPSLRKCESMLQKIGTEEPQSVRQRNHGRNQCAIPALGLDHVHVIAIGAFSPDNPPAHDNALLPVLSSLLVLTPLLPPASPPSQHRALERNVTSVASSVRHLTSSPARCATIFMRIYGIEHLFKLNRSSRPTSLPPSESLSCQQLAVELNVTPTAFGVEGLGASPKTAALQYAPVCDDSLYSGRPQCRGKLGVQNRVLCPGVESLAGTLERGFRCPGESPCSNADRPQYRISCLCGLTSLSSVTPSSALTLLQHLASPSNQRLSLDLDVAYAVYGVGGLDTSPLAAALRFLPVCDDALSPDSVVSGQYQCRVKLGVPNRTLRPGAKSLAGVFERGSRCPGDSSCSDADRPQSRVSFLSGLRALGPVTPPSALTLLQPLASPSTQRLAFDLNVRQAAFGVGGLGTSPPAAALRFLPACDDALSSDSAVSGGIGLPDRVFLPSSAGPPSTEVLKEGSCCLEKYPAGGGDMTQGGAFAPSADARLVFVGGSNGTSPSWHVFGEGGSDFCSVLVRPAILSCPVIVRAPHSSGKCCAKDAATMAR